MRKTCVHAGARFSNFPRAYSPRITSLRPVPREAEVVVRGVEQGNVFVSYSSRKQAGRVAWSRWSFSVAPATTSGPSPCNQPLPVRIVHSERPTTKHHEETSGPWLGGSGANAMSFLSWRLSHHMPAMPCREIVPLRHPYHSVDPQMLRCKSHKNRTPREFRFLRSAM